MTLGERIMNLRMERQMSQSDLAEALDVSRQSISKWETDSSVPELDKLVALCEIFGVSMDMLVRGIGQAAEEASAEAASDKEPAAERTETETAQPREVIHVVKFETRKIAGLLLFIMAMVCIGTGAVLGDTVAGFLLALPFIVCGIICIACRKRAGLWCAWVVYMWAEIFLRFATGVSAGIVGAFLKGHIDMSVSVIIGMAELALTLGLVVWTVASFRNADIRMDGRREKLLLAGWIVFLAARAGLGWAGQFIMMRAGYLLYVLIKDWLLFAVLVMLLVFTYHWWKGRQRAAADN